MKCMVFQRFLAVKHENFKSQASNIIFPYNKSNDDLWPFTCTNQLITSSHVHWPRYSHLIIKWGCARLSKFSNLLLGCGWVTVELLNSLPLQDQSPAALALYKGDTNHFNFFLKQGIFLISPTDEKGFKFSTNAIHSAQKCGEVVKLLHVKDHKCCK